MTTSGDMSAVLPIRSEAFGQRHFILAAPDGVLVDVITPIEPDESYGEEVRPTHSRSAAFGPVGGCGGNDRCTASRRQLLLC